MIKLLTPFIALSIAVIVAMALDRPAPRADVVVAQSSDCFTLDPQRMSYTQDLRMARSLYEGLVRVDSETTEVLPAVAESWTCSEDGRTWTFTIRPEARWSNGDPVTAGDFVYSWRRAMMPETAADYSGFFDGIKGAKNYLKWRSAQAGAYAKGDDRSQEAAEALLEEAWTHFDETVGLKAVDDRTLVVTLDEPIAYFLELCAFGVLSPVHPPTVESFVSLNPDTGLLEQEHGWTKPGIHVGNGPYQLARWRYKRDLRIERNPHYWNPGMAAADTVEIRCIQDPNTTALAFQAGTVDWVTDLLTDYRADMADQSMDYQASHAERLRELLDDGMSMDESLARLPEPGHRERRDVHVVPAFGTFYFSFNCRETLGNGRPNPLADPGVRRALALSIDKERIIDRVLRTGERLASTLVPPDSIVGYESPSGIGFDPDRARRELAAAGWKIREGETVVTNEEGEPFPTIDLLYSTNNPRYRDMGSAMRDMWSKHLGLETAPRSKDSKAYKEDLKKGDFMVARGGWYGDYGDPTTFLEMSRSDDGNNDRGYRNDAFDTMLVEAARQRDPDLRMKQLQEAERFLVEDAMPFLPVYHYSTTYMFDPTRLRGISRNQRLQQNYWKLQPVATEPLN
jgi:oligopeptide transport system substrate-binding protein